MKTIKILFTALLMLGALTGFAQANNDNEEYKTRVRNALQLDYSMPDYSTSRINANVMGDRLAKIVKKTLEMCQNQSNLGSLSVIQSRSIEGLSYCTITNVKFAKATKQGNDIILYFNTTLADNIKKISQIQYSLCNLQAVVVDTAVGILGQTKFFGKQRYAVPEFGNNFNRPVQSVVGHGVLWCGGLMAGLLRESRHLPAPLNKRRIDRE